MALYWESLESLSLLHKINMYHQRNPIGRVSLARENEAGAIGDRKSILFMLTYRTLFCLCL